MNEVGKALQDHEPATLEPLLREVLGRRLRELRLARGERLIETAARAGISPQYLSEVERGLKEPSSEMIAAITGALRITLVDLTLAVVAELQGETTLAGVTSFAPPGPDFTLYAVAA
ncbi:helix-turn-helix domain-containing protein [Frondihabitans sucicola]|nr:helix-turn-helix transcriptional regulator [Frondihabitans sucicola]